ncbi:hypothetical protein, partial [Agrobacterium sp. ST15.13.015]|uniref:hypothetical protein n=1 Tax=Agrobacterium sp. ST15.13.015 TaxID=3017319 RepID=UPI0022EC8120
IIRHQAAQHSCLCSCPRQRCRPAPALDAIADVLGRITVAPETKPRRSMMAPSAGEAVGLPAKGSFTAFHPRAGQAG